MKEFPKEWCTDVCQEVVEYLNKKYDKGLTGCNKFYGEKNNDEWSDYYDKFGTYLSHEEFMEAIKEQKMKVGDMVWVSLVSDESAKEFKTKRELLAILPKDIFRRYICRNDSLKGDSVYWTYAVPIAKEERKLRELVLTDLEWEKVQKLYS